MSSAVEELSFYNLENTGKLKADECKLSYSSASSVCSFDFQSGRLFVVDSLRLSLFCVAKKQQESSFIFHHD